MRLVVLAGGTGSAKLLNGLSQAIDRLTVVSNIGDNIWLHGLYICPDIDIATYCLAGILDDKGWGIKGDTFNFLYQLSRLGFNTWFKIGDKDLATHIVRTMMLRSGMRLTNVTKFIAKSLGLKHEIIPSSDSEVETHIITDAGELHLQEFWVREGGRPRVYGVKYSGVELAEPSPEAVESILKADRIIICPANPISSIGPILSIKGIKEAMIKSKGKKIAISPIIGTRPLSGPAGKFMEAMKIHVSPLGVATLYKDLIDVFVVDKKDRALCEQIESLGIKCFITNIVMRRSEDQRRLAMKALEI